MLIFLKNMFCVRKLGGCVLVMPYILFFPLPPLKSLLSLGDQEVPCCDRGLGFPHPVLQIPAGLQFEELRT